MRRASLYTITLLTAFAAGSVAVSAQEFDTAVKVPGITGLIAHTGVPQGFDPLSAADSQLEDYGFPKRPDINDTKAYSRWVQAVSGTRIVPEFENSGRRHLPNQRTGKSEVVGNTTSSTSGNWSGYSIQKSGTPFVQVEGIWIVPSVNNQFSSINGYMSEWVGIDGNCTCNDLIQDGTEQQYTGGKATYYAWIEFIPQNEVIVPNFSVAPGDVITAYSWVSEKSNVIYGDYYLYNANTKKSVSASIKIPPKTTFSGKSVEWIVERTEVGGSFSNPLPNYAFSYMDNAYAFLNGSSHVYTYTSFPNESITMNQGSTKLSKAYGQDSDSLWFEWLAY